MLGGALPRGAPGGLGDGGAEPQGPVDEQRLVPIGGPRVEEPVEGEVDGVRAGGGRR